MEIPLTNGGVALIDDADYPLVSRHNWHWRQSRGKRVRYAVTVHRQHVIRMHRLILGLTTRLPYVDHVNWNGLDNRRRNLRVATNSQNMANSPAHTANTTGFRGVSFNADASKFAAQICCNGRNHHLGYFTVPHDAARAYDAAARRLFGPFAYQNLPFA